MVYMWGDQRFYLEIPLKFRIVTPTIKCDPSEVKINFCFINFQYDRKIKLINLSNLGGKVAYTPTEVSKSRGNYIFHVKDVSYIESVG